MGERSKRKPGLLFVVNALSTGGAEIFILRLAQALKKDWRIFVTTIDPKHNQPHFVSLFLDSAEATLIPPVPAAPKGLFKRWRQETKSEYWSRMLKKHAISAVHSHLFSADCFTLNHIRPNGSFSWVITTHSSPLVLIYQLAPEAEREAYFQQMAALFKEADQVITVSSVFSQLNDIFAMRQPSRQIWLGLEAKSYQPPVHQPAFHFGMIGRSTAEKGWEIALDAFCRVQEKFPEIKFTAVIPPGTYTDFLQTRYATVPGLVFRTDVSDARQVMPDWHAGLLSSLRESTPYTIIECLSMGRPVIASRRGDIELMLQTKDGRLAGQLIDDGPDKKPGVQDLAEKMEKWIAQPTVYQEACAATSLAFEKFDMNFCAAQYQDLWQTLFLAQSK